MHKPRMKKNQTNKMQLCIYVIFFIDEKKVHNKTEIYAHERDKQHTDIGVFVLMQKI